MIHQGYLKSSSHELDRFKFAVTRFQSSQYFADVAPHLKESGKGKLSLPYKSVLRFCPTAFGDDPQTTGDCTSHGTRNAHDISRAVAIDLKGAPEEWIARGATEPIYGARGYAEAGMSPAVASEWCHNFGVLVRQNYDCINLTVYDASIGTKWGADGGPPDAIKKIAAEHPCRYIAQVRSIEEARDALANGYGLHVGSNQGFGSTRDSHGFAEPSGHWAHDMAWGGCDDTGPEPVFVVLQSWGDWNSGGQPEFGPLPTGAFLIHADTAASMIAAGEAWCVGDVKGFPKKELPDYGSNWM
jgi:hypothetical protein